MLLDRFHFYNFKVCKDCKRCLQTLPLACTVMYTTFFVNNSKSRKNVSYGKLSIYLSVITGSYVVTYLGRDDLNLKIPLIIQLTLGS